METHLDGIRLELQDVADLARCQVGAVAQRDQVTVALAEP
jgi:hypothetical protein